jgi:hypothetical protein
MCHRLNIAKPLFYRSLHYYNRQHSPLLIPVLLKKKIIFLLVINTPRIPCVLHTVYHVEKFKLNHEIWICISFYMRDWDITSFFKPQRSLGRTESSKILYRISWKPVELETYATAALFAVFHRAVLLSTHNWPSRMSLFTKHCQEYNFHYSEAMISRNHCRKIINKHNL